MRVTKWTQPQQYVREVLCAAIDRKRGRRHCQLPSPNHWASSSFWSEWHVLRIQIAAAWHPCVKASRSNSRRDKKRSIIDGWDESDSILVNVESQGLGSAAVERIRRSSRILWRYVSGFPAHGHHKITGCRNEWIGRAARTSACMQLTLSTWLYTLSIWRSMEGTGLRNVPLQAER